MDASPARTVLRAQLVLTLLGACGRSGGALCESLVDAEHYADAAPQCLEVFRATGSPSAAVGAARSAWELEHDDDVRWLTAELIQGPEAAWGHFLRGRVAFASGDRAVGYAETQGALLLDLAARDHAAVARDLSVLSFRLASDGHVREAIAAAEETRSRAVLGHDVEREVWALCELGDLWANVGDPARALMRYHDAVARQPITRERDRAEIELKEARVQVDLGHDELARLGLYRGLARAASIGASELVVEARINLAEIAWDQRDLSTAATHLSEARRALPRGARPAVLTVHQVRLALERGQLDLASQVLDAAPQASPDWEWRLDDLRGEVAEARGTPEAAVDAYMRSVETIERLRTSLRGNELKATFLTERRHPQGALFVLAVNAHDDARAFAVAEALLSRSFLDTFVAAESRAEPLDRIETVAELTRQLDLSPTAALRPASEVLAAVRGTTVLVYLEVREVLYCIVIEHGKPRVVRLAARPDVVGRLVERSASPGDSATVGDTLGAALLPDELGDLADRQLYVVSSGPVAGASFASLRRRGALLIEDHDLAMIPSVGVLARLLSEPAWTGSGAVVLGDPHGDLPAARLEAIHAARRLGVSSRLGSEATWSIFVSARRAGVLHIASHSEIGRDGARLALANALPTAVDILAAGMRPRLAVLASCASGVTTLPEFWGSLAAAFLAAGSRSVVASMWAVDDRIAGELLDQFYAHGGAVAPSRALAAAQRALARRYPASAWAAFVIIGAAAGGKENL